jgi:hypothetical protein
MILRWGATLLRAVGCVIGGSHGTDVVKFSDELTRLERTPAHPRRTSR